MLAYWQNTEYTVKCKRLNVKTWEGARAIQQVDFPHL